MQGPKRQLTIGALRYKMMYMTIRDLYHNPQSRGLNNA
jgi:hypothetical protein